MSLELQILRVHGIEIVDEKGVARIKLSVKNEALVIELYHPNGKIGLEIGVDENQSEVCLKNSSGEVRAVFGIGDEQPGIGFYAPGGQRVFEIYLDYDRGLVIGFYDKTNQHRMTITVDFLTNISPIIWIYDEIYQVRVSLSLMHKQPIISFYDKFGKQRLNIGIGQEEIVGIWLNDWYEKPQIVIGTDKEGLPRL